MTPGPGHDADDLPVLGEQTTDSVVVEPWMTATAGAQDAELHLVVAWSFDEPWRVGQAARVERDCWLGRPDVDHEPLVFCEQRPGSSLATPAWTSTRISRRQLRLRLLDGARVGVQNVGRRELLVNGLPAKQATLGVGDTLMVKASALFVVEARPREFPALRHYAGPPFGFGEPDAHGMVGESPHAWRLREQLAAAAAANLHVLLLGESGAGKELAAKVVHGLSARSGGPMVERNAATIPSTLLDAELFGSVRNFPNTGSPERPGLIGAAHGGHLLLDEVGELGHGLQAHLLRVLDSGGHYQRLGESTMRLSDFRLLAATNRDPNSLKHDFLARFGERIEVPGLNARRSDIALLLHELSRRALQSTPGLVERFFEPGGRDASRERGERGGLAAAGRPRLDPHLVDRLVRHTYRYHTRELARLLRVSIASSPGEYLMLTPEVERALAPGALSEPPRPAEATLETLERPSDVEPAEGQRGASERPSTQEVAEALEATQGNVSQAAERLGISRHQLHRWIRSRGLVRRFKHSG